MQERRQVGAEQGLRPQCLDAERTVLQQHQACSIAVQEAWKKQRIAPRRDADQHARHGAARGRAPPGAPRRQNSPPKNAGASWAMAAKDNKPIAANWVLPSAR